MKIVMLAFLCCSLLVPSGSFATAMESNTDRRGGDYKDFELSRPDPELCQAVCMKDPKCRAWTYARPNSPNITGRNAHCWLNSVVPKAVSNKYCTSGIKTQESRRQSMAKASGTKTLEQSNVKVERQAPTQTKKSSPEAKRTVPASPTTSETKTDLAEGKPSGVAAPAAVSGAPQTKQNIYKIEQITKEQFSALPGDAVIEHKGQKLTKTQFISQMAQEKAAIKAEHERDLPKMRAKLQAAAKAKQAEFTKAHKDKVRANNEKLMAEVRKKNVGRQTTSSKSIPEAHARQYLTIQKEARDIYTRAKKVSPAERKQLDQRAGQLAQQLNTIPLESRAQMTAKASGPKRPYYGKTETIAPADLAQWNMTNMLNVCQIVNCPPPAPPKITGIENGVTPGGQIAIKGEGFTDTGYYGGNVSLFIPAIGTRALSVVPPSYENWSDNLIVAHIPEDIEGVIDQNANIQIMTGDGYNSNSWQVQFIAAREMRVIPGTYNNGKFCDKPGEFCDHVCDVYKPNEAWATFYGWHHTWCCLSGDSGRDLWSMKAVKNQWKYHHRDFTIWEGTSSGCEQGFASGASLQSCDVNWNTGSAQGTCRYVVTVWAEGPKGVPYDKTPGEPSDGYGIIIIK